MPPPGSNSPRHTAPPWSSLTCRNKLLGSPGGRGNKEQKHWLGRLPWLRCHSCIGCVSWLRYLHDALIFPAPQLTAPTVGIPGHLPATLVHAGSERGFPFPVCARGLLPTWRAQGEKARWLLGLRAWEPGSHGGVEGSIKQKTQLSARALPSLSLGWRQPSKVGPFVAEGSSVEKDPEAPSRSPGH